jgi:dihydroorotate dehydrogenase electron transfer subunit
MMQRDAEVRSNQPARGQHYRMELAVGEDFPEPHPGQFVMLRLPDRLTPLLRRPFSVHQWSSETDRGAILSLLYRVVGPTTTGLAELGAGDIVDVVGPLGRGFTLPTGSESIVIAGGGIGVAPLLFLADRLLDTGTAPEDLTVYLGGKSDEELLCTEAFFRMGLKVHTTTDDGSTGDQCLVTDPLERGVRENPPDRIYACGPPGMLECVMGIARLHGVRCQLSIEAMMACGIGACLGCAVENREDPGRYLHACLHGPVFDADRIRLDFR